MIESSELLVQALTLVACEAVAARIVEAERHKSASQRVALFRTGRRHMCLHPSCRHPVVGEVIFGHCEKHLDDRERRWVAEDFENNGRPQLKSVHSVTVGLDRMLQEIDDENIKLFQELKDSALVEANRLLDERRVQELEREKYLPVSLRNRIKDAEEAIFQSLRYSSDTAE
ncbi:hypothetical protein [Candidatus Korobacter versatilis]|uniref:hypothetical protein n=1 Tax=Candidatus Korobacter versatilis TaxID=658062 RepID=UPI0011D03751|nr:hypothetical protein [Candidatus Koribacter versatilis]